MDNTITPQIFMSSDVLTLLGSKLYSGETPSILIRELIQNSVDAKSTRIDLTVNSGSKFDVAANKNHYTTDISCIDNGIGMDRNILLNVFLGIGKSYKTGENNTGGFGIAKVSLFCANSWAVRTNKQDSPTLFVNNLPDNQDLDYKEGKNKKLSGTVVNAHFDEKYISEHTYLPYLLISKTVRAKIRVNERIVKPVDKLYPISVGYTGKYNYTISKAKSHKIFADKDNRIGGYIVYRINGLPQFVTRIWEDDSILLFVDFDNIGYIPRDNEYPFSLSRESVKYEVSSEVSKIIEKLSADKLSRNRGMTGKKSRSKIVRDLAYDLKRGEKVTQNDKKIARLYKSIIDTIDQELEIESRKETESKLAIQGKYLTGITFDEEVRGMRQDNLDGFVIYWVNPHNLELRDKSKDEIIFKLYFLAAHEITHANYSCHNEEFSSSYGDNQQRSIGNLLENLPKLRRQVTMIWDEDNTI